MPVPPAHRLGDQAFLLAYDGFRHKLIDRQWYLVRAAVLAELFLLGRLVDQDGSPRVHDGPVDDPILRSVLDQISAGPARTWPETVVEDAWATYTAVRDRLVAEGRVTVLDTKILKLFPVRKVTVEVPDAVHQRITAVRAAVLDGSGHAEVDPAVAVLAALADAVALAHVFSRDERNAHQVRIELLAAATLPIVAAARAATIDVARQTLSTTGGSTAGS